MESIGKKKMKRGLNYIFTMLSETLKTTRKTRMARILVTATDSVDV